jgi:hypothetical protein
LLFGRIILIRKSLIGLIWISKWLSLTVRGSPISTTMHRVVRELTILVLIITVSLRNIHDIAPDIFLGLQVRKKLSYFGIFRGFWYVFA